MPASLKKTHNDHYLSLKPARKYYDWQSNGPPPLPQEEEPAEPNLDQQDDFDRPLVEVSPGVEMCLRGSSETQQAMSRNYVLGVNCLGCTLRLKCIANAEYILCPLCHCVSPLELSFPTEAGAFGVGLGFVVEEQLL